MRNLLGRRLFPVCPHLPCQRFWCRAKLVPKLAALGWRLLLHFARGAQKDTSWTLDITNGFQREYNGAKDDMLRALAEAKYELCFALKVTTGSFFTSFLTKFTKGIMNMQIFGILILLLILEDKFCKLCIECQNCSFKTFLIYFTELCYKRSNYLMTCFLSILWIQRQRFLL